MAKKEVQAAPAPEKVTLGEDVARTLAEIRAAKIREIRARAPQPSYDQIAVEAGCSVKTVYNVLTGKTHATGR